MSGLRMLLNGLFFWRSKFVFSFVTKVYNYRSRCVPNFRTFIS